VKFEAAWALTNIVSGNSAQTCAAVKAGATERLLRLLLSEDIGLVDQAMWAVANIAGGMFKIQDCTFLFRFCSMSRFCS
jgi:importin subunit alpha-2